MLLFFLVHVGLSHSNGLCDLFEHAIPTSVISTPIAPCTLTCTPCSTHFSDACTVVTVRALASIEKCKSSVLAYNEDVMARMIKRGYPLTGNRS